MNSAKSTLRRSVQLQKKAMTQEDIDARSARLCACVLRTEAYRQANTIYGYLPFNQEVRLFPLLRQALADGKQIALPKCYGKDMRFILMKDLSRIQAGSIGAPEPMDDEPVATDPTALVIVPGVVFDTRGYRIGYGGGYYDRFLSREPRHPTIALCYDFQLVDQLSPEPHDIPADIVFSV